MKNKNIIIAASGTGGHIYPGIALARELEKEGFTPVFFVSGNEASVKIIGNSGFKHITFNLSGMPGKLSFSFLIFFVKLAFSFFKALKNILSLKPRAVVGVGGYISVPAVSAAATCAKKTFIHEQNYIPGKANKLLNVFAHKTFISFNGSEMFFKNKKNIVYTGCPVRKEIPGVTKQDACGKLGLERDVFTLMIFGGSLGAVKLNENSFEAVKMLSGEINMQVIHITGKKSFDGIKLKAGSVKNYLVFDYMHNIADAYAAADMVICRAGAGAVFELMLLEKPALLIPYPYAADNHQYYNAEEASRCGRISFIEEKEASAQAIAGFIRRIKDGLKYKKEKRPAVFPQEIMAAEIIKSIKG